MNVRVERLRVANWRGIVDAEVHPGAGAVTWLLGRNGAGKSSLIDAFGFVADVVRVGGNARRGQLRGRPDDTSLVPFSELLRDPLLPLLFEVDVADPDGGLRWRYEITLQPAGEFFRVEREWLSVAADATWRSVLERDENGARWLAGGSARGDGRWEPTHSIPHQPLVATATDQQPTARWMGDLLRGVWLLRLDPLLMRSAEGLRTRFEPGSLLERHGRNLWAWVAHRLHHAPDLETSLNQATVDSGLPTLRVNEVGELRYVDPHTGERPMWQASDGTLVNLALAALAVLLPEDVTIVLLDEPAVAVDRHAARETGASILELSELAAVLACTQTLEVVDDFSKQSVILVETDGERGARFTRLVDHAAARRAFAGSYKAGQLAWAWWERGAADEDDDG
jgi:energy-coupling factor transporter ATP-binding protein EcfA2